MEDKILNAIENLQKQMGERLTTIEADIKYLKEQQQELATEAEKADQPNIRTI